MDDNDNANPKGTQRPTLSPPEQISDAMLAMGEAIKARVHALFGPGGVHGPPRTRPVLPIHERNRPRIQFRGPDTDPTPPSGTQRPRLSVKKDDE